jgi:hypothetical protein
VDPVSRGNHNKTYNSWKGMMTRCFSERAINYDWYGGRGITVCERWQDYDDFYADMGPRPDGHTLDRIDSDGHYEPRNCRWASTRVQTTNRAGTRWITYNGETRFLKEWAEVLGFNYITLQQRIYRRGWSIEKAFTTPTQLHFARKK